MRNKNIKRASALLLGTILSATSILTSCDKMLEVDSDRQVFDPELNSKTDSVFYAFGIAQAMQQLADQYFYQGEMRGELVATTEYTDSALTQLKDFSAGLSNKYDSAYVYYRVINNCNYYIAHRDTTLRTGSTDITKNEYVAVKTFRAWAYLQLARNYGRVPFFTEPLTSISQIDDSKFPEYDLEQIASILCADLAQYAGTPVPNYGASNASVVDTRYIFIPVDIILGDLYLETGRYQEAADSYFKYLETTKTTMPNEEAGLMLRNSSMTYPNDMDRRYTNIGEDYYINSYMSYSSWVSLIPMAANRLQGVTTTIPYSFGYDYYSVTSNYIENMQLVRSADYNNLVENLDYYYYKSVTGGLPRANIASGKYGDMRSLSIMLYSSRSEDDDDENWIRKTFQAQVHLYRKTTVYLHLCEALNRLELPDAAFAFLKEGLTTDLLKDDRTWLSDEGKKYFSSTFFNSVNEDVFGNNSNPIHGHGCGATADGLYPRTEDSPNQGSPYQFKSEIARKFSELNSLDNKETLYPGLSARIASATTTKADTIMAMEELLCDEEAMEFCFEGTRWYDLMRFARHKNRAGLLGNAWLANKVKSNNPVKDLTNQQNWYLPFKK